MKIAGIIAEFNPFHNGHKYLITQAKKMTGADAVIVLCSGNFVQRGMPAIWDKSLRTRMALQNGADVVFELPVCYATASAETFARAGVKFLSDLGCVDVLCFGCETDNLPLLQSIASVLQTEPDTYKTYLAQALKNGMSYPKARMAALRQYSLDASLSPEQSVESVLSMPNNILAIEYLKALAHFQSAIQPVAIKRMGVGYHSTDTHLEFASATGIRQALYANTSDRIADYLPPNCTDIIPQQHIQFSDFDTMLGAKLISANDFSNIYGINEELSNRILHLQSEYRDIESFIPKLQSKNYTYAAISRALLHILLDITAEDIDQFIHAGYFVDARLLGFHKNTKALSAMKANSSLPIISKFADAYQHAKGISKEMLDLSLKADHLYRMVSMHQCRQYLPTEFERNIVIH